MKTITKIEVPNDNMLCVFAGTDIVLPHKLTPNLQLEIGFKDFIEFVKYCVAYQLPVLFFGIDFYEKHLKNNNYSILMKAYYAEIAVVIVNEINLAVYENKSATIITHHFEDGVEKEIFLSDIDSIYNTLSKEDIQKAQAYLESRVSGISNLSFANMNLHNQKLYKYATYLTVVSYSKLLRFNII